jgi:hypothetical protein
MDSNAQRRRARQWPVDGVSAPIAGDIGYVVVSEARQQLTVELNAKALRNLPACVISRRVLLAARQALASASCEDGVVELFLGDSGDVGHRGRRGLEPLTGGYP